jgi:putative protease
MKNNPRRIELLSPARDLQVGIAAIDHGADAVYIGASGFSARAAAGNSIEDIARLVEYAHKYGVRIYVTLNTILYDDEINDVKRLVDSLYEIGVDALIVQDMALLEMGLPPIELHASTQTDIREAHKARGMYDAGFTRVVLARELSLEEIGAIHSEVPQVEIEAFVHGALCVSYSGQCYMSHCFKARSANRGVCSQVCRLPYTVRNAQGKIIARDTHILSLKDMNRSMYIEDMIDAGVTSFKIEGRLKDMTYVKNVTAYYRKVLDDVIERRDDVVRSSVGKSVCTFEPRLEKSFNRGFTSYFIDGTRSEDVSFPLSPKSRGEEIGLVKDITRGAMVVDTMAVLNNGDGFLYVNKNGSVGGFRIDRADGNKIYPTTMPRDIERGSVIYRNMDMDFTRRLSRETARRNIAVDFKLCDADEGFALEGICEDGVSYRAVVEMEKQLSLKDQRENIRRVLCKMGDTHYEVRDVDIAMGDDYFIPSSVLAAVRRECVEGMDKKRMEQVLSSREIKKHERPLLKGWSEDYRANVSNALSVGFYKKCGLDVGEAYEIKRVEDAELALCKHCIRYALGRCPRNTGVVDKDYEVLYIESGVVRMKAEFDCKACQMKLYRWK